MLKTLRFLPLATIVAAVLATAAPGIVQAEERACRGTLGAITVDNLRVPQGATCTLNGTYVKGTIKVERDATLVAKRVRVVGNVQAENHRSVAIRDASTVGGSVQVKQDLQCKENRPAPIGGSNVVGGNKEDQCRRF
jgi:hypothetical protein